MVILNHNPSDPKRPGDVSFFSSIDGLVSDLRAIDLQEGGYYALDSTGRTIAMRALGEDPEDRIEAILSQHPTEGQLAQRMLKHFLLTDIEDEGDLTAVAKRRHLIEREHSTERLVELIPDWAVEDD